MFEAYLQIWIQGQKSLTCLETVLREVRSSTMARIEHSGSEALGARPVSMVFQYPMSIDCGSDVEMPERIKSFFYRQMPTMYASSVY